jgi:hypothetical protein
MRANMERGMAQGRAEVARPQLALLGTLLLLGIGYALLVTAPVVFQRFSLSVGSGGFGSVSHATWLPAAAASGFAVGGAAALLYVLARLVRDIERQPYACLAPVLAVFTAFVLAGVRVDLPLFQDTAGSIPLGSEHFAALAMAIVVLGGGLVQQRGLFFGLLGVVISLAPAAMLIGVVASDMKGFSEAAVLELDPRLRLFTVLLTASTLILIATALASRALVSRLAARARSRQPLRHEDTPRLGAAQEAAMWQQLRSQADAAHMGARPALAPRITRQQIASAIDSIDIQDLTWSSGFPLPQKQRGMPGWLVAVLTLITVVAVGAVSYRAWLWNKNREAQIALQLKVDAERQAREFEEQRQLRAREAEQAQQRLAAALAAPLPAPDATSTTPVLVARGAVLPEASAAVAPVAPSVDELKKKAELEAEAAREQEAKAAREAEKAREAELAAQDRAERDAKEAALAEERRAAREAKEAREAERERRREQRELRERYVAQKKAKEKAKVEQKERVARDKAVGGMLDGNRDPIFGL